MIEYPTIQNSSKAPRINSVGFAKFDGSNFRAKWTKKRGFNLYGSRHQLIDETDSFLGNAVKIFKERYKDTLENLISKNKNFRNEREIVVFGEYVGPKSFAGMHYDKPEDMDIIFFDILVGQINRKFLKPYDFIEITKDLVPTSPVLYIGNLTDQLITDVREGKYDSEFNKLTNNKYPIFEGLICKGTTYQGQYRGSICMTKIKTNKYFELLKSKYGEEGILKYGE